MIYYVIVPVFSVLLVIFQSTFLDILFLGKIRLEITLIVVIYAGLYMNVVKGGALSVLLGFLLDSMTGVMPGLYVFLYVTIFVLSNRLSYRVYSEGITFIILFTFLCSLSEGVIIFFIYKIMFGVNAFHEVFNTYMPQSLVVAVVAPACFAILHQLEGMIREKAEE